MGNHSMPSKPSTLKRTVAAGAMVGCSAVGLGALSSVAAPTANACWLGCHHTTTNNTTNNTNTGVAVSVTNSNGNVKQSNSFSGNTISPQFGLGILGPTQASTTASIGNIAAANGVGNTVAVVVAQTTNNVCASTAAGSVTCS
jgi:hypothetical protein